MVADKELASRVVVKKKGEDKIKLKKENKKSTTWDSSSVEGKCEYESQNEGRNCSRCQECKIRGKGPLAIKDLSAGEQ